MMKSSMNRDFSTKPGNPAKNGRSGPRTGRRECGRRLAHAGPAPTSYGAYIPQLIRSPQACLAESPHPYPNYYDRSWTLTNPDPNATRSRVHFRKIETEGGYDWVYVSGGGYSTRFSGAYADGVWSSALPGRSVTVRFISDSGVTGWGFCIDRIETAP
jgi:hypothetical protein